VDKTSVDEWAWAPHDAVTFNFYKEGLQDIRSLKVTSDGEPEYEIVLSKPGAFGSGRCKSDGPIPFRSHEMASAGP
jgi:hypothetical protein